MSYFMVEHRRTGKCIGLHMFNNINTFEGADRILTCAFTGAAAISQWYIGLVDSKNFTGTSRADTGVSHPGWQEFTNYTYQEPPTSYLDRRIPVANIMFANVDDPDSDQNDAPVFSDETRLVEARMSRAFAASFISFSHPAALLKGFFVTDAQNKGSAGLLLGIAERDIEVWAGDELAPYYAFRLGYTPSGSPPS